ncbi:MAG: hypothetical protein MUQ65_14425 [Armatimonadetes bacterium]|nr:hypothetical protein [Armatimonadota bacterium]
MAANRGDMSTQDRPFYEMQDQDTPRFLPPILPDAVEDDAEVPRVDAVVEQLHPSGRQGCNGPGCRREPVQGLTATESFM